ncbi:hypothetical protein U9M48_000417 [Paspalum notatum var. saurae]|uniref:Uncharacterized protein n=1 Tax=Paspalum notatum var. saurae TaxID=547442 RepID=A0AAQ3SHE9_PASNO
MVLVSEHEKLRTRLLCPRTEVRLSVVLISEIRVTMFLQTRGSAGPTRAARRGVRAAARRVAAGVRPAPRAADRPPPAARLSGGRSFGSPLSFPLAPTLPKPFLASRSLARPPSPASSEPSSPAASGRSHATPQPRRPSCPSAPPLRPVLGRRESATAPHFPAGVPRPNLAVAGPLRASYAASR